MTDGEINTPEIPRIAAMERDLIAARRLLFDTHPCPGKYGDDGELQCATCGIDFKRDDINDIGRRILERGLRELHASTAARAALEGR